MWFLRGNVSVRTKHPTNTPVELSTAMLQLQHDNTLPAYLVPFRYMTFNDGQDVMEGQSGHISTSQAHHITQDQPSGILYILSMDVEGLQLTHTHTNKLKGWTPKP